jgi:Sulfatase
MILHMASGLALALGGWLIPRHVAGAGRISVVALLDAAPLALVALTLFMASGRPLFAGAIVFALGTGFAFVDRTMREVLREPVVFTALSELPQVFTHPHLYLPFAGTGAVLGGATAAGLAAFALLLAEPPALPPYPVVAFIVAGGICAFVCFLAREPWLGAAARVLWRLKPGAEPFADAARLGPFAMLITHGVIARAERPALRARLTTSPAFGAAKAARPIILVQCESFFDARRALPSLPRDLLSGYDAACDGGMHGQLIVPAWGANTMRAEFAVLTGSEEAALGYDRFNPYHALARARIASQVWRLRAAGYRTICLHPFDRRFFRRDLAMPALGFEKFLDRESLGGSRTPPYLPDPELADHILRVLDAEGPCTFIFAITMGNHGPWSGPAGEWVGYLDGLRQSDEMLRMLIEGLAQRDGDALLGFYGDHLPSLPRTFASFGFDDWRSDYVVWGAGPGGHRDLFAHELGRSMVDLVLAVQDTTPVDAVVCERHDA